MSRDDHRAVTTEGLVPALAERTHAWGNQYGKLRWCTERRRLVVAFWLALATPPSSAAGWSVAPGPATAARPDPAAAHNHLLAQALAESVPVPHPAAPSRCGIRVAEPA
jgi:hypothetical protein